MKQKIIEILKNENRLMAHSEIFIKLKEQSDFTITEEALETLLQQLSDKNIISAIPTTDGNRYCFVEEITNNLITKTPTPTNPEIKKINIKITIICALIAVVLAGFILFIYGLSLAGGWDGYGDFTLGGIGILIFIAANITLGCIAGPFAKITNGFNNWVDYNSPGADASCGNAIGGCGNVGCGYFIYVPLCLVFGLIGFIFGIITIKKLNDKKNNLK